MNTDLINRDMQLYELTQEEFDRQAELQKPIPLIMTHILPPETFDNQHWINKFWEEMAEKYGFNVETMRPAQDKGIRCFIAEPKP